MTMATRSLSRNRSRTLTRQRSYTGAIPVGKAAAATGALPDRFRLELSFCGRVSDMARQRQGRSLVEDVYEALRADILLGRRLPGSRIPLRDFAEEHNVSLSVVREAVTRLASEDLVEAIPQRGFRVRSLSLADMRDLTWVRIQIETLALRESIAAGDVELGGRRRLGPPSARRHTHPLRGRHAEPGLDGRARRLPRLAVRRGRQPHPRADPPPVVRRVRALPVLVGDAAGPYRPYATLLTSIARSARRRWPATPTGPSS